MTPTETLVAECIKAADDGWNDASELRPLLHKAADTLTTQSALIETLRGERDEARAEAAEERVKHALTLQHYEAALADARGKALEEAALVVSAARGSGESDLRSIMNRVRALKSA